MTAVSRGRGGHPISFELPRMAPQAGHVARVAFLLGLLRVDHDRAPTHIAWPREVHAAPYSLTLSHENPAHWERCEQAALTSAHKRSQALTSAHKRSQASHKRPPAHKRPAPPNDAPRGPAHPDATPRPTPRLAPRPTRQPLVVSGCEQLRQSAHKVCSQRVGSLLTKSAHRL